MDEQRWFRGACIRWPGGNATMSMDAHAKGSSMIVGSGRFKYRVNAEWAKLPDGWSFKEVGGVGVDSKDNVYVFNRGEHPMILFDRQGNFLRSWGEDHYPRPHGVHMAPDDTMFLTDDGGHFVRKVTLDGKVLLELGVPGRPAPFMSGEPFHRCTHTALSPKGDIYVSDGYGNARVHKYSPNGELLMSWGEPGTGEGEFNIVHNICCDADGWLYVADHENHRVQVFDGNGRYETQWKNLHRPCGLYMPTVASRSATSAKSARPLPSAETFPISGRGSASSIMKASSSAASVTRRPGLSSESSWRRMVSRSTLAATFTSVRFPGRHGRRFIQGNHTPPTCARCRSSKRSNKNPKASRPLTPIVARQELKHHRQAPRRGKPIASSR